jgi:hypothetical protein
METKWMKYRRIREITICEFWGSDVGGNKEPACYLQICEAV